MPNQEKRSDVELSGMIVVRKEAGKRYMMPADLRDMFFCIVERNGSVLVWLFRGILQQSLPISMM